MQQQGKKAAARGTESPSPDDLAAQVQQMDLGNGTPAADTPELVRFRSLPQNMQQRLLRYPQLLATAMHQYSDGVDCEHILMHMFQNSSELLIVPNTDGDNPVARALLRSQEDRAARLVELADSRNPAVLDSRSQWGESLLMLSTMSSSSSSDSSVMLRLLTREPSQLHRLYDNDGRNFLHHCTMEESISPLEKALEVTLQLMEQGRLAASQVSAAIHMNDRSGSTPMHMMADRNRRDMLALLLEFGRRAGIHINLDERQHRDRRWTPLMVAVNRDAVETAELLLENGADPIEELDTEGQSAEYMAAVSGSTRMQQLFGDAGASDTQPVVEGAVSLVKMEQDVEDEPSWLTKGTSVDSTGGIDSGLASFVDSESDRSKPSPSEARCQLSRKEIETIDRGLREAGKVSKFVEAFRGTHSTVSMLAQMSVKPVESLISQLAHDSQCRRLVRGVLRSIGEPHLLDSD